MIRCYWLNKAHAPAVSDSHPLVARHLAYRRKRRVRRAVAITCVSLGGLGAAAAAPFFLSPPPPSSSPASATSGNALPESRWTPEVATGAPVPIPEPPSALLLLPALAVLALIAWRARREHR